MESLQESRTCQCLDFTGEVENHSPDVLGAELGDVGLVPPLHVTATSFVCEVPAVTPGEQVECCVLLCSVDGASGARRAL